MMVERIEKVCVERERERQRYRDTYVGRWRECVHVER